MKYLVVAREHNIGIVDEAFFSNSIAYIELAISQACAEPMKREFEEIEHSKTRYNVLNNTVEFWGDNGLIEVRFRPIALIS